MTKYEKFIEMKNVAAAIHKELGMAAPPFDPFVIAEKLGIPVSTESKAEKISYSGSITKSSDGAITIWVNPDHHGNRQRFTVAHEIGHLMNGDLNVAGTTEFYDNPMTLDRNSRSKPTEWRANQFAAELLMPDNAIEKAISKILSDAGLKTMKASEIMPILAKKFGVSEAAMQVRLKVLGIIE